MAKNDNKSDAEFLRQRAEELLKKKLIEDRRQLSEVESMKLIHELEVHQIELELQNSELRQARARAEIDSVKYTNLYDFSPTGYFSLSREGKITELNLIAAKMLGKERVHLINNSFVYFVSDDTKPAFNRFLEDVFTHKTIVTCELTLLPKGSHPFNIHLSGTITENGEECLLSTVDITDRRRAEQALKESEEKYRVLLY